jgi:hypothetical protein
MTTPPEVIEKGEQEFEGALFQYETVASKDGFSEQYPTIEYERGKVFLKRQTLALLQALHDELEGEKKEMFVPEGEEMPANVFVQNHSYNEAIQDQQNNLQALIKKIQV